MSNSVVYALDFDGVICDSAVETAITGWKAAAMFWHDMPKAAPPFLVDRFRAVRPIIETGYEAILAMRLLFQNLSVAAIYSNYSSLAPLLLNEIDASADDLKVVFGETRDNWIAGDLPDWIAMNPLYPGVAEKLSILGSTWYVVTTKQERFVKHILQANGIELADERIFGLDRRRSKPDILMDLLEQHPHQNVVFVEDRLPSLQSVRNYPELNQVKLLLADWGYNIPADRDTAINEGLATQGLEDFLLMLN